MKLLGQLLALLLLVGGVSSASAQTPVPSLAPQVTQLPERRLTGESLKIPISELKLPDGVDHKELQVDVLDHAGKSWLAQAGQFAGLCYVAKAPSDLYILQTCHVSTKALPWKPFFLQLSLALRYKTMLNNERAPLQEVARASAEQKYQHYLSAAQNTARKLQPSGVLENKIYLLEGANALVSVSVDEIINIVANDGAISSDAVVPLSGFCKLPTSPKSWDAQTVGSLCSGVFPLPPIRAVVKDNALVVERLRSDAAVSLLDLRIREQDKLLNNTADIYHTQIQVVISKLAASSAPTLAAPAIAPTATPGITPSKTAIPTAHTYAYATAAMSTQTPMATQSPVSTQTPISTATPIRTGTVTITPTAIGIPLAWTVEFLCQDGEQLAWKVNGSAKAQAEYSIVVQGTDWRETGKVNIENGPRILASRAAQSIPSTFTLTVGGTGKVVAVSPKAPAKCIELKVPALLKVSDISACWTRSTEGDSSRAVIWKFASTDISSQEQDIQYDVLYRKSSELPETDRTLLELKRTDDEMLSFKYQQPLSDQGVVTNVMEPQPVSEILDKDNQGGGTSQVRGLIILQRYLFI